MRTIAMSLVKISCHLWNWKVHCHLANKSLPVVSFLCHMNPIHAACYHFLIHLLVILTYLSGFFISSFLTNSLDAFLVLLDLFSALIFDEDNKVHSSSLCSFLQSSVTSFFTGSNIHPTQYILKNIGAYIMCVSFFRSITSLVCFEGIS